MRASHVTGYLHSVLSFSLCRSQICRLSPNATGSPELATLPIRIRIYMKRLMPDQRWLNEAINSSNLTGLVEPSLLTSIPASHFPAEPQNFGFTE